MSSKNIVLVGGILLVLLTSNFATDFFGGASAGALFDPESPLHEGGRWAGKGLFLIGALWVGFELIRERARAGPVRAEVPARERASGSASMVSNAGVAEKRGNYLEAAETYDRLGDVASAARCYVDLVEQTARAGRSPSRYLSLAAARLWATGEQDRAIELLVQHNEFRQAADLRGKAGDWQGQAELLLQMEGGANEAAQVLSRNGDRAGAARALAKAGSLKAAVDMLSDIDPAGAARICEEEGQSEMAAELYAKAGALDTAAHLFTVAGNVRRAGQMLRELGDLRGAAEHLEKGGALAEAGQVYAELGETEKAMELLRRSGDPVALGRALEARGDVMGAARAYVQSDRPEEALKALAGLPPAVQKEPTTLFLAATCFLRLGKPEKAIGILRPLANLTEPLQRAESYYILAIAYHASKDIQSAIAAHEQVLAIDPKYRDSGLRLAELKNLAQRTASSPGPPPAPTLPQRYKLEGKLGEGAMGLVYQATDTILKRPVAIKVLSNELASNEKARAYFLREAQAAAGLTHPNVVTMFDAGVEGSQPFLVMEYLRGVDLETLTSGKPMQEALALRYAKQIADALAYVHAKGIVHRDVKPANIMRVQGSEMVKLMDFGVAHLTGGGKSTIVAGTPDFMAPEQMLGRGLGPWTDVFALGGTLYQFLTGSIPFPEGAADTPPDPRERVPDISEATAKLVMACLVREAASRPQSAGEVRDRIAAILG